MAGRESPYEAAPLSNAHRGLLEPARSDGGTRRYSSADLERLSAASLTSSQPA